MIDLDRLREARWQSSADARELLAGAGLAVLDAPVVWVCALGLDRAFGTPGHCRFDSLGAHEGCGWVALVPVKGGQDAS